MNDAELNGVKNLITEAIVLIQAERRPLDFQDVHERTVAHRLAIYIEQRVNGNLNIENCWDVDCEYNQFGDEVKELGGITGCSAQKKTDRIYPDIIVHKRFSRNNLIVIELKKNSFHDPCDFRKLELMTQLNGDYRYELGLFLNINGGIFSPVWFRDGHVTE